MSNVMKYIIVLDNYGIGKPYLFGPSDQHSDIAILFMVQGQHRVVGAGFVSHTEKGLQCWGRSVSLKIDSRGEIDSVIINRYLDIY